MSNEPTTQAEASEMFAALAGTEPPQTVADPLVEELRGVAEPDPNAAPAVEESTTEDEGPIPADVLVKLRKANEDAGKAGYRLGQERQEKEALAATNAALEARLAALESGTAAPVQHDAGSITNISDDQLDAFMGRVDRDWETNREDPYMKRAASYAIDIGVEVLRTAREEMGGVMGGVADMQFNQRLDRLGISRPEFDSIWTDPAYSWGNELSNDGRLAALETQARIPGRGPSPTPAHGSSAAGAPPTSGVDPRRTVETTQAPGSVQHPQTLSGMRMNTAIAEGDGRAAKAEARNLFAQLTGGQ